VTVILRQEPAAGDRTVLIHMGAGVVDSVVRAAIRNYGEYRRISNDGSGLFGVSVFALGADVTEADVLAALPHGSFGRSTAGTLRRAGFDLLPTSIVDPDMAPGIAALQRAHFDVVLDPPADDRLRRLDPVDDEDLEAVAAAHLTPQVERLVALFDPRLPK
jgi:hypothetical protein